MTKNPNAAPFDNRANERTFSDEKTLNLTEFIHAGADTPVRPQMQKGMVTQ